MIPVPLISPVQFYLKVFTCVVLGKEPVFIFLVVRTTKRPQTRWISSLESWVRLKRAPNTLACQTLHWWSCSWWHVCHHSWFHHPSIQTSTNLSCTCNQNQLTWSRGELLGLETCCFGQRPCRVWISADPDPYSLLMWEISLWFVLKYKKKKHTYLGSLPTDYWAEGRTSSSVNTTAPWSVSPESHVVWPGHEWSAVEHVLPSDGSKPQQSHRCHGGNWLKRTHDADIRGWEKPNNERKKSTCSSLFVFFFFHINFRKFRRPLCCVMRPSVFVCSAY